MFVPPSTRGPQYATWTKYYQGAALARFPAQSTKVLLQEASPAGSDLGQANFPYGSMTLVDAGTYKTTIPGTFIFRHSGGNLANFLYLDTHVEGRSPSGSLNSTVSYNFVSP